MSSGSVSDASDVNEGEGPKVVQSSFREPSIINKSVASKTPPPIEEKKEIAQPQNPEKISEIPEKKPESSENKAEEKPKDQTSPTKATKANAKKKKIEDHFCFEIPKMIGIPILNRDTSNPNTFDLNYLLNPDVQKIAQSGHRLTQSTTVPSGKAQTSPKNYIKNNINKSKLYMNSKPSKGFPVEIHEIPEIVQKKSKFDVEERFYKKAKETQEKIKNLKALKEIEEVDGCTFKPKIKSKRENKTYEQFYEYMKNYVDKKNVKIKQMKDEENKNLEKNSEFSHQPKLCDKSIQMIARKSDLEESTFDRLHKLYKGQAKSNSNSLRESLVSEIKTEESVKCFHPKVNKKSQMLNRPDPIEKILYDDALRRINKEKFPPPPPPTKFITSKSEKVLIEKVKRDFEEAFFCIETDTGELIYTKMIELFKIMHFVKDDNKKEEERLLLLESWKILSRGENVCKKDSILVFLLSVMGFYEDWMGTSDTDRLTLSSYESNKLHIKFDLFYTNRISVINKSTANKSYKASYEYSFHPQTIAESQQLAENWRVQHRSGGKIEDMLIAEKARTIKKIEEKRAALDEELLEECSFQPIIEQMPEEFRVYGLYAKEDLTAEYFKLLNDPKFQNSHKGNILYEVSKIMKEKKETKAAESKKQQLDEELKDCTFAPKLEERIFPDAYLSQNFKPSRQLSSKGPNYKNYSFSDIKDQADNELYDSKSSDIENN
jgi:hypothetical protein